MLPPLHLFPGDVEHGPEYRYKFRREVDSRPEGLLQTSTSSLLRIIRGLSYQSRADRLAETLGVGWAFGQDDIVMDEQRFFNVFRTRVFQLLNGLRKKINGRF